MHTKKLIVPRYMHFLLFISWLVYFVGYLARLNFGAVMAEIIASEGVRKTSVGLITTGASVTYAAGQIISGILGDRFSPRYVIFSGLLLSGMCNLFMPLIPFMEVRMVVWCINGFAQAMLWPPLLRIFTESYREKDLSKMYVRVSTSTTAGTIAVYLLAFVCIAAASWHLVFYISAFACILVAVFWLWGMERIEAHKEAFGEAEAGTEKKETEEKPALSFRILQSAGIVFLSGAILFHGVLKDSVTTWMPTFINDTYQLGSAVSILSTVVMPIFSMLSLYFASFLNNHLFRNEAVTSSVLFALAFAGSIGIRAFAGASPVLSLLFATIITSAMYGANLMLITAIPANFARYGKASTLTGVLNAFTYAGSALSTYGVAALSDAFGWNAALSSWLLAAGLGTLLCVFAIRRWTRFLHL